MLIRINAELWIGTEHTDKVMTVKPDSNGEDAVVRYTDGTIQDEVTVTGMSVDDVGRLIRSQQEADLREIAQFSSLIPFPNRNVG